MIAAASIAALVACSKTTSVYEDASEIGLAPVNYLTKANGAINSTTYPQDESFKVFAVHTPSENGTQFDAADKNFTVYLTDAEFVNKEKGATWGGKTPYYWPKTGSLFFAGYSPARAVRESASYEFATTPGLTMTGFTQGAYAKAGVAASADMVDLMWFDHTAVSANTGAPAVIFKHALSYLTMNFKSTDAHAGIFTLKKVTLKGVKMKGNFTSAAKSSWTFDPATNAESIVIFDAAEGQAMTATAFTADNLLIIPQGIEASSLEIQYEQKTPAQQTILNTQSFTLEGGDTAGDDKGNWLVGFHYTYNFTFTFSAQEEILLTPSVEAWSDATAQEIEVK